MSRVVAIANQKGGVAKTTSTHTLGIALARAGRRVLLVDLDPQACLTFSLGLDPDAITRSLHDVLAGSLGLDDVIVALDRGGPALVDLVPATIELAGAEMALMGRTGREHALKLALEPVRDRYDIVLIDCPPTLGVLTVNGLTAADEVLIPLQCEALSHRGVAQLLESIADVRRFTNPRLEVRGVIATMYDARTRHARDVLDDVRARFGLPVLEPAVPKSVRFAEAPSQGRCILEHAPDSAGAKAYEALATQLV